MVEALLIFWNGILLELRLMESMDTTAELGMVVQMCHRMRMQIF